MMAERLHDALYPEQDKLLLTAAMPLLNAIAQVRLSATHDDPAMLHQQLSEEIEKFEKICRQGDVSSDIILGARYCLCSALDEAVLKTPWGASGGWSGNNLLITFHNEIWGGEKFFQLLQRISGKPRKYTGLMEVIQYCLLLGYEGRFRTLENGTQQREVVLFELSELIANNKVLSPPPAIERVEPQHAGLIFWQPKLPLWCSFILALIIICVVYGVLEWRLNSTVEKLLLKIELTDSPLRHKPEDLIPSISAITELHGSEDKVFPVAYTEAEIQINCPEAG